MDGDKDPQHSVDTPTDISESPNISSSELSEREKDKYFDGREPGQWNTIYCKTSWICIISESIYVSVLLILSLFICFYSWSGYMNKLLCLSNVQYGYLLPYLYCFLSGLVGGTLFTIKWLYHSVARKKWHVDRILWRIFTPWISGWFALVMYILMRSGLFSVFDSDAISSGVTAFSVGFLVGYFSDSAMSKFREIADTLFGKTNS